MIAVTFRSHQGAVAGCCDAPGVLVVLGKEDATNTTNDFFLGRSVGSCQRPFRAGVT